MAPQTHHRTPVRSATGSSAAGLAILVVLLTCDVFQLAEAWWCMGHMSVALIAKRHLTPNALAKVEQAASHLSKSGPFPMSPDFVQMACWPDDLKAQGNSAMTVWHFVDKVYNPSNYPISNYPIEEDDTVEDALSRLLTTVYKSDKNSANPVYNLDFALGFIVHFYGDIHQPLHCTTLYSQEFPDGDRGGNSIAVKSNGKSTNLHAVWDSICDVNAQDLPRPLNAESYASLEKYADYLEDTYSFTASEINVYNTTRMALESLQWSKDAVYPDVYSGSTLSSAYLTQCKEVAEGRIVLAGLRLAFELNYLLKDASIPDKASTTVHSEDVNDKVNGILEDTTSKRKFTVDNIVVEEPAKFQETTADEKTSKELLAYKINENILRTQLAIGKVFKRLDKNGKRTEKEIDYDAFI